MPKRHCASYAHSRPQPTLTNRGILKIPLSSFDPCQVEGRFQDALSTDSAAVKKAALGAGLGQVPQTRAQRLDCLSTVELRADAEPSASSQGFSLFTMFFLYFCGFAGGSYLMQHHGYTFKDVLQVCPVGD
jgi:hypothetical protein